MVGKREQYSENHLLAQCSVTRETKLPSSGQGMRSLTVSKRHSFSVVMLSQLFQELEMGLSRCLELSIQVQYLFGGIICELRETGGRNLQSEHRRWSFTGLMSDPYAISRDGLGVLVGDRFIFIGKSQDDSMGSLGILDVHELKLILQRPQASQLTSIRYEKGLPCQMQL